MTNNEIIYRTSVQLVEEGILDMVLVGGMEMPEPIHTFNGWKELGYSVKKGEKSKIKFPIWKHTTKTIEAQDKNGNTTEQDVSKMFMKTAYFFTFAQVEPLKA